MGKFLYTPSFFAKLFTGCGAWSLDVIKDQDVAVTLSIDKQSIPASLSDLTFKHGVFWDSVSYGDGVVLKGVSKSTISQLQGLQSLQQLFLWHKASRQTIQDAYIAHGWLTVEERNTIISSRPRIDAGAIRQFMDTDADHAALDFWKTDFKAYTENANRNFLNDRLIADTSFFQTVEKSPLTQEQSEAVLCFDNRTLLIASAGSGKTSTIIAKTVYAIQRGYFKPEEILVLAFNRKAAQELRERIQKQLTRLGIETTPPTISTFHAFSLAVIGKATGIKPSVAPWVENEFVQSEFLQKMIARLQQENPGFSADWKFFTGFLFHETFEEEDSEEVRKFRTRNRENVKSKAERILANWLYYNNVDYQYESNYPYPTADSEHRQYQPDFYIPHADLYIELWAIDENKPEPPMFKGYKAGMRWKRHLHQKHGTVLLEVTAADVWNGTGLERLERQLSEHGVSLTPRTEEKTYMDYLGETTTSKLLSAFIAHVKNGRLTSEDLDARNKKHDFGIRGTVFLRIFWTIFGEWQKVLRNSGSVDFDDMTVMAADFINAGKWKSPYKLVMADEFQDTNIARAELLSALTAEPGHFLFVVGDDWQSINRFAGSDVSIMTGFENRYGEAQIRKLETTFRFPQTTCSIMGEFVQRNKKQIRKTVHSAVPDIEVPIEMIAVKTDLMKFALNQTLAKISEEVGPGRATVLVLGRYRKDQEYMPTRVPANLSISFATVHSSKGAEADYVLIPGVDDDLMGFPCLIADDPLLDLCMPEEEPYPHAEERRLFYVAVTRARRKAFIFATDPYISPFMAELAGISKIPIHSQRQDFTADDVCPKCGKGLMVIKNGKYGQFLSCSRFPHCRYHQRIKKDNEAG